MKVLGIIIFILLVVAVIGYAGLQVRPKPFPPYVGVALPAADGVPIASNLPAPVERYMRMTYGDQLPLIQSAVIDGRVKMQRGPIPMQGRFRFVHDAGQSYRHYFELTWFGIPFMRANESYVDGYSLIDIPGQQVEGDPSSAQAANLGLWAESAWLPAIYFTDPRVRWEAVDDHTAILVVPFEETEDRFVVRFDPESGQLRYLEAMRFQDPGETVKHLWITENLGWGDFGGVTLSNRGAATWFEDGKPWAIFDMERITYDVDVSEYVRQSGL